MLRKILEQAHSQCKTSADLVDKLLNLFETEELSLEVLQEVAQENEFFEVMKNAGVKEAGANTLFLMRFRSLLKSSVSEQPSPQIEDSTTDSNPSTHTISLQKPADTFHDISRQSTSAVLPLQGSLSEVSRSDGAGMPTRPSSARGMEGNERATTPSSDGPVGGAPVTAEMRAAAQDQDHRAPHTQMFQTRTADDTSQTNCVYLNMPERTASVVYRRVFKQSPEARAAEPFRRGTVEAISDPLRLIGKEKFVVQIPWASDDLDRRGGETLCVEVFFVSATGPVAASEEFYGLLLGPSFDNLDSSEKQMERLLQTVETRRFPCPDLDTFLMNLRDKVPEGQSRDLMRVEAPPGGLLGVLAPFLLDSMKRGHDFGDALQTLYDRACEEGVQSTRAHELLQHVSERDLLIALLHMGGVHGARHVLSLAARAGTPLPLLFSPAPQLAENSEEVFMKAFVPLLATPLASKRPVVWMGTGPGKSSLLQHFRGLFCDASTPTGTSTGNMSPLHEGSIDLLLPGKTEPFVYADCHGILPFSTRFRAMTKPLCVCAAFVCVHVAASDVFWLKDSDLECCLSPALEEAFSSMPSEEELERQGNVEGEGPSVLLFLRDAEKWDSRRTEALEREMKERFGHRFCGSVQVPNVCLVSVDTLRRRLTGCLKKAKEVMAGHSDCKGFPSFSRVFNLYREAKSGWPIQRVEEMRSDFDLQVRKVLEDNFPEDRRFASRLFPIDSATSELARQERRFAEIQQRRAHGADHGEVVASMARARRQQRERMSARRCNALVFRVARVR
uniref:Uncharacterized protein n=1 Tax=Chromera velia CCMP2878 TaxID=1169474 RepID=A0A0G4HUM2_9ALVE|eukprot:Cvel_8653.t1-p1 / transcript=Cvel_8653.t1 / gene=Cvel_8653 / organism=Chromera_velia_CCMP2878 / gene_product=hypothetical protein / transcript_product=hypothetical protein / location=Cvel_scaffold482:51916-55903(-) / protein_length=786 / sequence_SO=supercontig / SO=protein_coding / is_pseudo=false